MRDAKTGLYDSYAEYYNIPSVCEDCGGIMIYEGVGIYHCEECGKKAFDDYGKVRDYLETHKGANVSEVENGTGVSSKKIMRMLKEDMLMVAQGSRVMITCERCGAKIRSGRFCAKCETDVHRILEDEARKKMVHNLKGVFVEDHKGDSGQRRFLPGRD